MDYIAKKIGCGRYIQAPGAVSQLGKEAVDLGGKKAVIIGGRKALASAGAKMEKSLKDAGVEYTVFTMTTDCTYETMNEIIDLVRRESCNLVIGCGGGKVMDMSKGVAKKTGLRLITVPSSCATFNCWSVLSVIYYPDGKPLEVIYFDTEVDCALVDTEILVSCPNRMIASGMIDSFAKHIEGDLWNDKYDLYNLSYTQYAAKVLARAASDTMLNLGEKAFRDNKNGIISPEFDKCVFAIMGDSCMAGGLTYKERLDTKYDFAHDLYYSIRRYFTEEAKDFMHGEIMGVTLEGIYRVSDKSEFEINNFRRFKDTFGHPQTLKDLNIAPTDENMKLLLKGAMEWGHHPECDRPLIWDAINLMKE